MTRVSRRTSRRTSHFGVGNNNSKIDWLVRHKDSLVVWVKKKENVRFLVGIGASGLIEWAYSGEQNKSKRLRIVLSHMGKEMLLMLFLNLFFSMFK